MEVSLMEMLDARERRARRQRELLEQYRQTLLCFTMNIAGPVKNSRRPGNLGSDLFTQRNTPTPVGTTCFRIARHCRDRGNTPTPVGTTRS